ncbi:hypothetical protein EYF80_023070 [Liparis tanakae]|uniref:Uncharacterized protein n=1 Tax=Liparis tanakae TaxID=230148 RepID=A0A4Z2HMB4_9TELE|nr:hypothetical protein EYF80_023070 [Liparis tanakae]
MCPSICVQQQRRPAAYPNQESEVLLCTQIAAQRIISRRQKLHTTASTTKTSEILVDMTFFLKGTGHKQSTQLRNFRKFQ